MLASQWLVAGSTLRFSSPSFSFEIFQPVDWVIDTQSAAQIAHFVMHPKEANWRQSRAVVYGRFVARSSGETKEDFVREDEKKFGSQCVSGDIRTPTLGDELGSRYLLRAYDCGSQHQLVAVARVPRYFAVFVLATQHPGDLKANLDPFRRMLYGFKWIESKPDPPRPHEPIPDSRQPLEDGPSAKPPTGFSR